jgi:putative transposase
MRNSRVAEERNIGILREQEAGARTAEVCDRHGISQTTFYKWKSKDGGMDVSVAARLKGLDGESLPLKKLLAKAMLDLSALKDLSGKG